MQLKLVAAALITRADGDVLITRRRPEQPLGGFWELPGGKLEPGEAPIDALAREIAEELDCELTIGRIYDVMFHHYPTYDVLMLVYTCALAGTRPPRAVEVAELAWVPPSRLPGYSILPADAPIVARLVQEGAPPPPSQ